MSLNKKELKKSFDKLDKPTKKGLNKNLKEESKIGYSGANPSAMPWLDIYTPNGLIDMSQTRIPVLANGRVLMPFSGIHQFNDKVVREYAMYQRGGENKPIRVTDPNDPRLIAYKDSLQLHNQYGPSVERLRRGVTNAQLTEEINKWSVENEPAIERLKQYTGTKPQPIGSSAEYSVTDFPWSLIRTGRVQQYKKPVQPYEYTSEAATSRIAPAPPQEPLTPVWNRYETTKVPMIGLESTDPEMKMTPRTLKETKPSIPYIIGAYGQKMYREDYPGSQSPVWKNATNQKHGGEPSAAKAEEMLHNPPGGRKLTDKQRKYFAYLAYGKKQEGGEQRPVGNLRLRIDSGYYGDAPPDPLTNIAVPLKDYSIMNEEPAIDHGAYDIPAAAQRLLRASGDTTRHPADVLSEPFIYPIAGDSAPQYLFSKLNKSTSGRAPTAEELEWYHKAREKSYSPKGFISSYRNVYQGGGQNKPIYVNDPNDPRLKAYRDSLSLYKTNSDQWVYPGAKPIAKEDYDKKSAFEQAQPSYDFDYDQFNKDKKAGKVKPFTEYVFKVLRGDKAMAPKDQDAYDRNIGVHYSQPPQPYVVKQKDGTEKIYEHMYNGKIDKDFYILYDPVTETSKDMTTSSEGPDQMLNIFNPHIKPVGTDYYGLDEKKDIGGLTITSESSASENDRKLWEKKSKDIYHEYTYGTTANERYKKPEWEVRYSPRNYNADDPRLGALEKSFNKNFTKRFKEESPVIPQVESTNNGYGFKVVEPPAPVVKPSVNEIMMPTGQKISKEAFIKQYGAPAWERATNNFQGGGEKFKPNAKSIVDDFYRRVGTTSGTVYENYPALWDSEGMMNYAINTNPELESSLRFNQAIVEGAGTVAPVAGVGAVAKNSKKIKAAVEASKESGVLSEAYKLNPYAYKPTEGAWYRRIGGKEGLEDLYKSGKVRPLPNPVSKKIGNIELTKTHSDAYFSRDVPFDARYGPSNHYYKGPYMVEVNNQPFKGYVNGRNRPGASIGIPKSTVRLEDPNMKIYKEHWWDGYREVPKGGYKNNFQDEFTRKMLEYKKDYKMSEKNPWMNPPNEYIGPGDYRYGGFPKYQDGREVVNQGQAFTAFVKKQREQQAQADAYINKATGTTSEQRRKEADKAQGIVRNPNTGKPVATGQTDPMGAETDPIFNAMLMGAPFVGGKIATFLGGKTEQMIAAEMAGRVATPVMNMIGTPSSNNAEAFANMPKVSETVRKDAMGYLERRQFIKNLQEQKLIGKDFNLADVNYAARSTDKTNTLTKLALDREATRFRGVSGSVPKNGIGYQEHTGISYDMSKPNLKGDISEFDNMIKAGVDFNDPVSIGKYQATHVPLQNYGYRSGMPSMRHIDGLYASKQPNSYGNYQFKMFSPRDYTTGAYKDWFNKYYKPENNLEKLAVKKGHYVNDFIPDTDYEMPVAMYKGSENVVGKRGQKMFDIDESFPFVNHKQLSPEQQIEYNLYKEQLKQNYNTGWRGQYKQGGGQSLERYQDGKEKKADFYPKATAIVNRFNKETSQAVPEGFGFNPPLATPPLRDPYAQVTPRDPGMIYATQEKTLPQSFKKSMHAISNPLQYLTGENPAYESKIPEDFDMFNWEDYVKVLGNTPMEVADNLMWNMNPLAKLNTLMYGTSDIERGLAVSLGPIGGKVLKGLKSFRKGATGARGATGKVPEMNEEQIFRKKMDDDAQSAMTEGYFREGAGPSTNRVQNDLGWSALFNALKDTPGKVADASTEDIIRRMLAHRGVSNPKLKLTGSTDVPYLKSQSKRAFDELSTHLSFGSRPLEKTIDPYFDYLLKRGRKMEPGMESFFRENVTDPFEQMFYQGVNILPEQQFTRGFKGKEAFRGINPNKMGGESNWLDKYM